jgi:hypothetical protein
MFDSEEVQGQQASSGETAVTELTLEQQLAEATSLIELQRTKLDGARQALQQDQPKLALDILS